MKKRILISPNSFKECASAVTIANLIRINLSVLKDTELITKPISDGGDGFLDVCKFYFSGEIRKYSISRAYDDSHFECPILYCENRKEIYIETAEIFGLKVIPLPYRNRLRLSTKGLGEVLKKIDYDIKLGKLNVIKLFLGIGGTATIDMGIGMMSELGLTFLDSSRNKLEMLPINFHLTNEIEYDAFDFSFELIPVIDVANPLLGDQGGINIFGKQKNADERTILQLENRFNNLLNILKNKGLQLSFNSLSGAGGGIPAAFQIFYNSSLLSSFEFIGDHLGVNKYSSALSIDYIITGEGAFDLQSGFGKGADTLINLFASSLKTIFLICGRIDKESLRFLPGNVYPIEISNYFEDQSDSITNYKEGVEKACTDIIKHLNF